MLINFKEKNKWGYYNNITGRTISARFYAASDFVDDYAIVKEESSSYYGVINKNGEEVLPLIFSSIKYVGNNIFVASSYNLECLYNQAGKIIDENGNEIPSALQDYKIVKFIDKDLYYVVSLDDKGGIVYRDNLIISFDKYCEIKCVRNGLIVTDDRSGKCRLYNLEGNEIQSEYKRYDIVSDRYIIVHAGYDKGYGVVDLELNVLIEAKYSKIEYVGEDIFYLSYCKNYNEEVLTLKVNVRNKCYLLNLNDTSRQIKISPDIDWCEMISEDCLIIASNYKYGLSNSSGDIIVRCEYDHFQKCDNTKNVILERDNKYYLVNILTSACSDGYHSIVPLSSEYFKIQDSNYGIMNSNLDVVLPLQYNYSLSYIDNNKFSIIFSDKKYIINEKAQILLDCGIALSPEIISVQPFSEGLAKVKSNKNLIGFINEEGKIVIPCKFVGNVSDFHDNVSSVSVLTNSPQFHRYISKEWKSLINHKGNFIVKFKEEYIDFSSDCQLILDFDGEVTRAFKDGKWALVDINCTQLTQFMYDEIVPISEGFYKVRCEKLWGVISSKGDIIIPCYYYTINQFDDNTFQIVLRYIDGKSDKQILTNHKGEILDQNGEGRVLIRQDFAFVSDYEGNFAIIMKYGKYGVINANGKVVVDCHCDSIRSIFNDHVYVIIDSKNYLLSLKNDDSIELPKCNTVRYYSDSFIILGETYPNSDSNYFRIIDKDGHYISNHSYNEISDLVDGYSIVKVSHYPHSFYGVISSNGTEVIPAEYYSLQYISESKVFLANSVAIYKIKTIPHYIDLSGNIVILDGISPVLLPEKYLCGRSFSCGLAAVAEEYKTIDNSSQKKRRSAASLIMDELLDEDMIIEKEITKTRYGFIDVNGIEQIPCQYDDVSDFQNNFSIVTQNNHKGVINTKGDLVISIKYDEIDFLTETLLKVKSNGLWGIVSISDEIVIPISYLSIGEISENLIAVKVPSEITDNSLLDNTRTRLNRITRSRQLGRRSGRLHAHNFDKRYQDQSSDIERTLNTPEPKGKWGYINLNNEVIVSCQFSEIRNFKEGLAAVKDTTWKYIDRESNTIISLPASATVNTDFCNGVAKVTFSHGGNMYEHILLPTGNLFIDNHEVKIDFNSISYIEDFHEGLAKILIGSNWGFINTNGEIVIEGLPSEPNNFSNGLSTFKNRNHKTININVYGEIVDNSDGQLIVFPEKFCSVKKLIGNLYVVERKSDNLIGVVNSNLDIIIPFSDFDYEVITKGEHNVYLRANNDWLNNKCSHKNKYGIFYNICGQRVVPCAGKEVKISPDYSLTSEDVNCGLAAVSNEDGLWGFVNQDGEEIIPCIYDSVSDFENGYCLVCKDYKKGVINTSGDIIIKLNDFSTIENKDDEIWSVTHNIYGRDTTYQTTDGYGDYVETEYWIPDVRNINNKGEILIPLYGNVVSIPSIYEWTDDTFHEGFLCVCKNGKWGIINTRLELVINCIYDEKFAFSNGVAIAHIGNKTAVIDSSGRLMFSGEYSEVKRYQEFNVFVCLSQNSDIFYVYDMFGFCLFSSKDVTSRILLPDIQELSSDSFYPSIITPISCNYFKFEINASHEEKRITAWGLCDITGRVITDARFDDIGGIGSGLLSVAKIEKERYSYKKIWGFANLSGKVVIDFQYSYVSPFINGLAKISKDGRHWGLLTTNGIELTNCIYDKIEYMPNNEIIVSNWDKTKKNILSEDGQIHYTFVVVTNARGEGDGDVEDVYLRGYDWCSEIYHEHCIVQKDNLFGIINQTGHITYPLSEMGDVKIVADKDGYLCFKKHDEYKKITNDGRIRTIKGDKYIDLPAGIHWCKIWNEDFIEVESNGKWGLLNSQLEMIIEAKYDYIQYVSNNFALCKSTENKKTSNFLINFLTGEELLLPYHHCSEFENGCSIVSIITKENYDIRLNRDCNEYAYGLIDYSGKELLPCKYEKIQFRIPPKIEKSKNYYYDDYDWREGLMDAFEGDSDAMWGRLD